MQEACPISCDREGDLGQARDYDEMAGACEDLQLQLLGSRTVTVETKTATDLAARLYRDLNCSFVSLQ
jgi:hypothetical protein